MEMKDATNDGSTEKKHKLIEQPFGLLDEAAILFEYLMKTIKKLEVHFNQTIKDAMKQV